MGNKITLQNISATINSINIESGDRGLALAAIDRAKHELQEALVYLCDLTVKGKEPLDGLLGCILAIEQIIGDTENKGE